MKKPGYEFTHDDDDLEELIRKIPVNYNPNPVASRLHRSLAKTRLNVGGLGSGKTHSMVFHLNNMCLQFPGAKVVLARKDLGDLRKTAQADYLEKAVIPETVDRFNINENTLYYKNGSICYFMETKTPSNFKSLEIVAYGIEEADENDEGVGKDRLMTVLNGRLRQKIFKDGRQIAVPYVGIWTYNPTDEDHWLAKLEDHPTEDMEVFRSTTYDNEKNLPVGYIQGLLTTLAPWEIRSLIFGERAYRPKGKPVIHGFTVENNVRHLQVFPNLPIIRSWDWGFNHPCASIAQYDPEYKRFMKLREVVGNREQLKFFAPKVIAATQGLVGPLHLVKDYGDPHGADQKDVGESSIEYLRIHHGIHVNYKRQTIKTGLDEIQELVLSEAKFRPPNWIEGMPLGSESRFLVDPSCKLTIAAYMGGYYRGEDGLPAKDDLHDHPVDTDRYSVVATMGAGLIHQLKKRQKRFIPSCAVTGY